MYKRQILAIGRVIGETAALIYTAGTVAEVPKNLMGSGRTLAPVSYTHLSIFVSSRMISPLRGTGTVFSFVYGYINVNYPSPKGIGLVTAQS